MTTTDVIIIGAGPIGLELAAALKLLEVDYLHLDAGQVGHTISWYPKQVRFFSGPDRIAIAGVPLVTTHQEKATREQYLAYLQSVVLRFDLKVKTFERVTQIKKENDLFVVQTQTQAGQHQYAAKHVVLAIGDMHRPRKLNIPGEELSHVSHYFDEPFRYFQKKLLIVGGKNSAVEAAIRCHRAGAIVSISYRQATFDDHSVKYWLTPEIDMLIKTGQVTYYPKTHLSQITPTDVLLEPDARCVEADFVLLLIGYQMDTQLLKQVGVELTGQNLSPTLDCKTMETNVPGLYVAGTAAAGTQKRFRLFIENCHAHVARIVKDITGKETPFETRDKTHSQKYALPES